MGFKVTDYGKRKPVEPPVNRYFLQPDELAKYRAMKPEPVKPLIPTIRKRGPRQR